LVVLGIDTEEDDGGVSPLARLPGGGEKARAPILASTLLTGVDLSIFFDTFFEPLC